MTLGHHLSRATVDHVHATSYAPLTVNAEPFAGQLPTTPSELRSPDGEQAASSASDVDGRRLRRQRNRTAVIDALLDLFAEGEYTPSAGDIATRAGLSMRSLFRYFDDVDDLIGAAIDRHQEHYRSLVDPGVSPDEPSRRKVVAVAQARVRLFEAVAPSARAARVWAHRHPVVRDVLGRNRAGLRTQLRLLFARELRGREDVLAALDALCSFEAYDLLRSDQGRSVASTVDALGAGIHALIGAE